MRVPHPSVCTSDLPAPNNYQATSAGQDMEGLLLNCGGEDETKLPEGALLAEYEHTLVVEPEGPPPMFEIEGALPEGLIFNAMSGTFSGMPTEVGQPTVDITVSRGSQTDTFSCELLINPALGVDLPLVVDTEPFCLERGTTTLLDVLVEGTGDGSPITCTAPGGNGNGNPPPGITINEETCAIEGQIQFGSDTPRYGTWAFIVAGEQSGNKVHVPYCVSRSEPTGYEVTMAHSGLAGDSTLTPITREFEAGKPVDIGVQGDPDTGDGSDPLIHVIDTTACGTSGCYHGFAFRRTLSPFEPENGGGSDPMSVLPKGTLLDGTTDEPIGFFHSLTLSTNGQRHPGHV